MEKFPFFVAIFLLPIQIFRISRVKLWKYRSMEILISALIIPLCLTSWPIYLNFKIAFSVICVVFGGVLLVEFIKWKNLIYLVSTIFLMILAGLFFLMAIFKF